MAIMQILYCKRYPDGYNKISAIMPLGHKWGLAELNKTNFDILTVEISDKYKLDFENLNKYCINITGNGFLTVASKYQNKIEIE